MNYKQAMKELGMMAQQYGLTLYADGYAMHDAAGFNSFLNYAVVQKSDADYIKRKATTQITVCITVRRMGGDAMTIEQLQQLGKLVKNAALFLADLQAHPLQFVTTW